ncbi:MAG: hypothetical protein WC359_12265 [Dehalococcoidia bacterium]|jgi:hypothetical protein
MSGKVIPKPAARAAAPEPVTPAPVEVALNTLPVAAYFMLNGVRHRVATLDPEIIVCHTLRWYDNGPLPSDKCWMVDRQVGLSPATKVKPI